MRRVIYSQMVSLDGYIDTEAGYTGPNWAVSDDELVRHFIEQEDTVDLHLYGRRIYASLADWWPLAAAAADGPALTAEYGRLWTAKPKVVFSRQPGSVAWNARLFTGEAGPEVARLKAQPGRDLALYGSVLAASLIPLGLIDEFWCYVNPAVLGRGQPMFPGLGEVLLLRLLEARAFGCGAVLLRFAPGRPAS